MNYLRALFVTVALLPSACVSSAKYDAALEDARKAKAEMDRSRAENDQRQQANAAQLDKLNADLQTARAALQENENQLSQANVQSHNLQAKLDESTAIGQRLRDELTRLGKNVDQLL